VVPHDSLAFGQGLQAVACGKECGRGVVVMGLEVVSTQQAPAAIGPYSQAIRVGDMVYVSGQIGLIPSSMELAEGFEAQAEQVFANLTAIAEAAGTRLSNAVKLTLYLTDLSHFSKLNDLMAKHCTEPYPARAALGVVALPRGALVEADAIFLVA
jgi:reactive intermediate/imine deaminase